MWKFVTRGIRESLERRVCRTNVYSQSSQDETGNNNQQSNVSLCCKKFVAPTFSAFYHGYCGNAKHLGAKDKENQNKYDAKYTWTDAVGWSSVLAVGYVVCQSLCLRRKLYEVDNSNLEKWRNKLLIEPQVRASQLLSHLLLPLPQYILPVKKDSKASKESYEILIDNDSSVEQVYGPVTAKEAFKQAVNEFSQTHEDIMGELELDCGSKAIEEKRYEDAVEHFSNGAKFSSAGSMFNLALCHELGLGTTVNYMEAAKYYQKAADQGHADAMYNLGVFYAQGKGGLNTNLDAARKLFTKAAKKGQTQALSALQIERSFKKRTILEHNSKYQIKVNSVNNRVENNLVADLINYNIIKTDLTDSTIGSEKFRNSYNESMDLKTPTDMFLDMLGVYERSAMPLISVGDSGS